MLIYIIIAVIIILFIALSLFVHIKHFKPNPDKAEQQKQLNDALNAAGFAYNYREDYFYSLKDCWQRKAGYCRLYDESSPLFNMIIDCEPITFSYGGKRWLIELWKGQYGITTGAEIGIYNTEREDIKSERFTGTFYEPISDDEQLDMSFVLLKNGKKLLKRKARHWWLTAFKLGEFSEKDSLVMNVCIKFPNYQMCKAFTDALIGIGYIRTEFLVKRRTVNIQYTMPHTPQPTMQEGVVQYINKTNCRVYQLATSKYTDTLDKLEYLRHFMPELYKVMMRSLYSKEFFKTFEWLTELIHGHSCCNGNECTQESSIDFKEPEFIGYEEVD